MNTICHVGYSPLGREVLDADIAAAYTTALAAIRCPDWASSREAKSLVDLAVVDEAMTFAQVKFRFPAETKFPCLPIRSSNQHGLIYPLEGESWCCGPELVVALSMGCSIDVLNGYRIEWIADRANPFATFAHNIGEGRKAAKALGDAMLGLVYKLLGNTLYGKVSQGVGSKRPIADDVEDHRIFDAEAGEMADLPPSSISCPSIAAWVTSFVRAVMIEALHRLAPTAIALQATTDGILFVGVESDIDISGPVARAFRRARALVTGESAPPIWEIKHCLPRVITFKTRGMISVVPEGWAGQVHLAKAGARFPDHLQTEVENTRYAEKLYRDRVYDTTYERNDLTSLSEQYKTGCDLTSKTRTVRLNWDYDFKNEPAEPIVDVEGVISFSTRPWRTVQEFERCRKNFENWQRSQNRVLKTARDYRDFVQWVALRQTFKLLRTRSDGVLPNLARVIAAEAMRQQWRQRPSYKTIAESLSRATGKTVTAHTINDIRRRRDLIPHQYLTMLSVDDIEFARAYGTNPIAVDQLRSAIIPGSIAERQFAEIWGRRLAAPVLQIVGDRSCDATEVVDIMEPLVAVAGGHGGALFDERPRRMIESSKPVKPASLAERAALACIERVIEPAPPAPTVEPDQPRTELTTLDQVRVNKWIGDRLMASLPGLCWHCRRPFISGQKFIDIRGHEVAVRFHHQCEIEWRRAQEYAARKALGLTQKATSP